MTPDGEAIGGSGGLLDDLVVTAREEFEAEFGRAPRWLASAPGRVNLIGEHTDYNDGFVLPMAIERHVVIAGAPSARGPASWRLHSVTLGETVEFSLDSPGAEVPGWTRYVQGVAAGCASRGFDPGGLELTIASDVPLGGGLSSSAALEVATATLVEAAVGRSMNARDKVLLCQEAEHDYAGVPCGIMDQFCAVHGRRDHLMLLDCRCPDTVKMVPMDDPRVTVLIVNSKVHHELAGGEYARRRSQCESAARKLGVPQLRDADMEDLEAARDRLDAIEYRRAAHVIRENQRTPEAANAIARRDWTAVGRLMYASHDSLRDDYEVSCRELDLLVEIARNLGEAGGAVIGSRMTGGGFGGCTVSLVRTEKLEDVTSALRQEYTRATGIEPTLFVTRPADGAQRR